MDISTVQWLANFGATGLFILLLVTGVVVPGFVYRQSEADKEKLKDALEVERQRNADLQQIAHLGTKAMAALSDLAAERREEEGRGGDAQASLPAGKRPP